MGQLEHFLKNPALGYKSCLTDADARGGEGVGSMRTTVDKGGGVQKLAKFCGRLLWMAPMDICSNPLQSLFCQLTCSNSKILLRRRSDRFGLRSTDSCTIFTICCVQVLGRPEWLKRSEDFLLRSTAVPYVSNLLTQSWMTDL